MDASEESPYTAATAGKNTLVSDDAVAEDAPAAKSILHDDDKIMQTIFGKSTSSSSPPIIDEDNIQKAISFLRNNEIRDVSPSEKRKYLTTKGINQDEIDTALDRLATTTTAAATDRAQGGSLNRDEERPYQHRQQQNQQHYQQQQNQYGGPPHSTGPLPPYQNHMQPPRNSMNNNFGPNNNNMGNFRPEEGGESSFLSFSSLAGGFCMSTFCLAAVRWLNGGDFVLFPPPVAEGRYIKQDNNETQNEDDNEDGETTDHLDETSYNSQGSGDPDISMILNGTANHESDVHGNNQEQSSFEDLVMEVKALSTTINSFREEQDRANRVATAQLGKGVTDDAMDFLRQQKPPVVQKKGDVAAIDKKGVSLITCLITEMIEELSQVKDSLGDVTVEDENSNTENDDDKKNDHTELSSKIDIAIGKGREILALVKIPDESSIDKIQPPQQPPPAEHENDEKDSDQDSKNTAQEEKGIKDDDEDKTGSDSTPAADDSSGESSDINQSSNDHLEEALKTLSQNNESEELKIGAQMLYLYCKNLSKNPTVPRYRKIYTNNNSFKKKVGNLVGAKEFLSALGFVERTNFFEWSETSPDTKSQLDFALVALEQIQKGQVGDIGSAGSDTSGDKSEQSQVVEIN